MFGEITYCARAETAVPAPWKLLQARLPSSQVWVNLGSSTAPHFLYQEPPTAQQLALPVFWKVLQVPQTPSFVLEVVGSASGLWVNNISHLDRFTYRFQHRTCVFYAHRTTVGECLQHSLRSPCCCDSTHRLTCGTNEDECNTNKRKDPHFQGSQEHKNKSQDAYASARKMQTFFGQCGESLHHAPSPVDSTITKRFLGIVDPSPSCPHVFPPVPST